MQASVLNWHRAAEFGSSGAPHVAVPVQPVPSTAAHVAPAPSHSSEPRTRRSPQSGMQPLELNRHSAPDPGVLQVTTPIHPASPFTAEHVIMAGTLPSHSSGAST